MKAAILTAKQTPFELLEWGLPPLQAEEVRVQVKAAALNRRDYWIQQGQYAGLKYPIIVGSDGAGIVTEVGEKVDKNWIGKEVILNPSHDWGENEAVQGKAYRILGLPEHGTLAEYVQITAKYLYPKPAHLSFEETAALPLAALTAFRALFSRAHCQAGDKVLITGVGGGVAAFALQFALAAGAEVYVTSSSPEKIEKAKELGAIDGINYKTEGWAKNLKALAGEFDVIVDSAGGDGFPFLIDLAKAGGRIVFYGGTNGLIPNLSPQKIFWKQLSILGSTMGSDKDFAEMLAFVNQHQIRPIIDSVFPLEQINEAMQKMASSSQLGKIVVINEPLTSSK
ncbi:MAG: zinc-binding dehydrogenase [Bacteroidia bacterium]